MTARIASPTLIATLLLAGCGGGGGEPAPPVSDTPAAPATADAAKLLRERNLVVATIEAEDHAEAARWIDRLAESLPDEPMVHANRGLVALRENRIDDAVADLDTAARLAPDDPDVALLRATAATLGGDDARARTLLEEAVAANPEHVRVRWALVEVLRRDRSASTPLVEHLSALVRQTPGNVVAALALTRALLEGGDAAAGLAELERLDRPGVVADTQARSLLEDARTRARDGDAAAARPMVIALDNVLKPTKAWQDSLQALQGPPVPIADPIRRFLATEIDEPDIGPRTIDVRFVGTDAGSGIAFVDDSTVPPTVRTPTVDGVVTVIRLVDVDNDRLPDVVCGFDDGEVRVHPRGGDDGVTVLPPAGGSVRFVLPWDADLDGDLDLLVGRDGTVAALLRGNGDGTFVAVDDERRFVDATLADLDEDGDLDLVAVTDGGAMVHRRNDRWAGFTEIPPPTDADDIEGVTAADLDNDGWLDLAWITADGACRVSANRGGDFETIAAGAVVMGTLESLEPLDYDNDGWLDLLVVADGVITPLRNTGRFELELTPMFADLESVQTVQVADHDRDGDLDLLANRTGGAWTLLRNDGGNVHGWQTVVLEAILEGGQRNNAFGVGGIVEVRAGGAVMKRIVRGPATHVGLGGFGPADTIRVLWPNGVPQQIVQPEPDQRFAEKQTLKGSCPFLFVDDGTSLEFVTDLLWRSPLGMKINEQTVAPVATTRDYVKIRADQLTARDGRYDLAITAALWETIFVDEVELWAVDHPGDVDVFVDERFVAPVFPPFEVHVVDDLREPVAARDHHGRDVLDTIRERDGIRLGGFARGRYQGVAEMHHVEVDLGPWPDGDPVKLIASGWIMPTDTSINVAVSQGGHAPPMPLSVWVADGHGGWIEAIPNAGFPAGKLKTIVLDLTGRFPSDDHRVRLRTSMEIYWDRVAVAVGASSFAAETVTQPVVSARLEHIGIPVMRRPRRTDPELPDYARPFMTSQWRDLRGWYTRYGDVAELLADTDDRYVIMNAGDVIRLTFEAGPPPPAGWTRDFVLFSDGWVKDGDWNTVASETVGPLPWHGAATYPADEAETPATLRSDHPDWRRYHTRYIAPFSFRDRLRTWK